MWILEIIKTPLQGIRIIFLILFSFLITSCLTKKKGDIEHSTDIFKTKSHNDSTILKKDSSGNIIESYTLVNGKIDGEFIYFYPNGKKQLVLTYEQDSITGYSMEYDILGKPLEQKSYRYVDKIKRYVPNEIIKYNSNGDLDISNSLLILLKPYEDSLEIVDNSISLFAECYPLNFNDSIKLTYSYLNRTNTYIVEKTKLKELNIAIRLKNISRNQQSVFLRFKLWGKDEKGKAIAFTIEKKKTVIPILPHN